MTSMGRPVSDEDSRHREPRKALHSETSAEVQTGESSLRYESRPNHNLAESGILKHIPFCCAEKSSPDLLAQSSSLYTSHLQRRLSDSHLHTYRLLEFRSKQPTRSRSYPSMKNIDCPLQQESTNTSPAASSSALESSSMKDHQLNQMMDCTSSDNGMTSTTFTLFHLTTHRSCIQKLLVSDALKLTPSCSGHTNALDTRGLHKNRLQRFRVRRA